MPPPAKKKRKTNDGAAVVGTRRTTRSQKPLLSIEMIGKVGSFADYDKGDLMNICVAVGPADAKIVRHVSLRNNMDYLRHTVRKNLPRGDQEKANAALSTWMEVNTDWRKACRLGWANKDNLCSASVMEEGVAKVRINPFILFNNPAVAIEFGRLDILKHLVEDIGIDINSYRWNGYKSLSKFHILAVAAFYDKACFDYLMTVPTLDVNSFTNKDGPTMLWQTFLLDEEYPKSVGGTTESFKALIRHKSFDPSVSFVIDGDATLPLLYACMACVALCETEANDHLLLKTKFLLDHGADPNLATESMSSPLDRIATALSVVGEDTEQGRTCKRLIAMMEAKNADA